MNNSIFQIGIEYKPESTAIYTKLNAQIEVASEFIYFILVRLALIGTILPLSLLSMVNYHIYGIDDGSFILPWPML